MKNITLKNFTFKGVLLGLGLLSATTFMTTSASAQTRSRTTKVTRRTTVTRTVVRQPVVVRQPTVVRRSVIVRQPVIKRTIIRQPVITRRVVRRPIVTAYRTIEGTVTNDLSGNDFILRQSNGQSVRVFVPSGEPHNLSRGDLVQATGALSNGTFRATSASILRNR